MAGRNLSQARVSCHILNEYEDEAGAMTQDYVIAPETLIQAYTLGVFPMAEDATSTEMHFYEPEIRGVLPLNPPHIPKRLLRTVKQQPYEIRWNTNFTSVVPAAKPRQTDQPHGSMLKSVNYSLHSII